jgi:[CysO sulfur-carrier protein]-S-L-cysteine hydrolase
MLERQVLNPGQSSRTIWQTRAILAMNVTANTTQNLELPRVLADQIARLARKAVPLEIVGLLAGPRPGRVSAIYPLENVAANPERAYVAEPAGLARALASIRSERLELVAIYHSHPNGPANPSETDIARSAWDVPNLIVDARTLTMRAWLMVDGVFEVQLDVDETVNSKL